MKNILLIPCFLIPCFIQAQQAYFQQQVNYDIAVSLDDREHTISGTEVMEYINHSPDQLNFIWFHLWPNAYKNDQTDFARQMMRNEEGKKILKKMKRGWIEGLDFSVNGKKAELETDPAHIDMARLLLPEPLAPGGKIEIKTPFTVKIPSYVSRSGYDGDSYMMCQWYPKPAVYDRKGWHPIPYLDQGEFYSEFGNYSVSLTVPPSYIVGATGVLQDAGELKQYREMGSRNVAAASGKNVMKYQPPQGMKTLHFSAENVHDFAWFADRDFVIRYDTLQLTGRTVDVFTFHHTNGNKSWINSAGFVKSGARSYSSLIGDYAWPVVQAVEGPKNQSSGGMEYPMITLITSPDANEEMLDATITHEVGHNWFYGMLASNEREHAWMDEGINTYYQFLYEALKYHSNSIFGNALPADVKQKPLDQFQAVVYMALNKIPMEIPIETPAENFKNEEDYSITEYIKTSIWMYLMELELGKDDFHNAMKNYFEQWKFRHPYPEDLKDVLEKSLNKDLTPYFDLLKKQGSL